MVPIEWHSRGRRFDSAWLHQIQKALLGLHPGLGTRGAPRFSNKPVQLHRNPPEHQRSGQKDKGPAPIAWPFSRGADGS
jgi:hypothetical protein